MESSLEKLRERQIAGESAAEQYEEGCKQAKTKAPKLG
jgi:hypothetical protein